MKYLLTIILFFSMALPVAASEVTGTITTGLSTGNAVDGVVIVAPTANPVAGEYTGSQSVALTGGEGAQSIRYTTDGSAATCSSGSVYTSAITVDSNVVIEAVACYANNVTSPKLIAAYIINPPTPAPSGGGGGGGGGGGIIATPANSANDFNNDGSIDVFDFNVLVSNWGTLTGASKAMGDADGDGDVDIYDFNLLISTWNSN